jgi:hypothetical protein
MSRWVAGHDGVSVLMRVLERRLVHFKAHPWPATTGQVFKSIARFNDSISSQISQHNRKKKTHGKQLVGSTKPKGSLQKMKCGTVLKNKTIFSLNDLIKNSLVFFLDGKKNISMSQQK